MTSAHSGSGRPAAAARRLLRVAPMELCVGELSGPGAGSGEVEIVERKVHEEPKTVFGKRDIDRPKGERVAG